MTGVDRFFSAKRPTCSNVAATESNECDRFDPNPRGTITSSLCETGPARQPRLMSTCFHCHWLSGVNEVPAKPFSEWLPSAARPRQFSNFQSLTLFSHQVQHQSPATGEHVAGPRSALPNGQVVFHLQTLAESDKQSQSRPAEREKTLEP
jgi:hypothetical protein